MEFQRFFNGNRGGHQPLHHGVVSAVPAAPTSAVVESKMSSLLPDPEWLTSPPTTHDTPTFYTSIHLPVTHLSPRPSQHIHNTFYMTRACTEVPCANPHVSCSMLHLPVQNFTEKNRSLPACTSSGNRSTLRMRKN